MWGMILLIMTLLVINPFRFSKKRFAPIIKIYEAKKMVFVAIVAAIFALYLKGTFASGQMTRKKHKRTTLYIKKNKRLKYATKNKRYPPST